MKIQVKSASESSGLTAHKMWITFYTRRKTALNGLNTSLWFSKDRDKILQGGALNTPWKPQWVLASKSTSVACMQLLSFDFSLQVLEGSIGENFHIWY